MPSHHTLIEWPPNGYQPARPRYNWQAGTVPPYSSLWMTSLRFAVLNRPLFKSLNEDLQGEEAAESRRVIELSSSLPWPEHESIDMGFFVEELQEPIEIFRWAKTGDFPVGLQELFSTNTRVCGACIQDAFHTVLFNLRYLRRCPVHSVVLLDRCPTCGKPINERMYPNKVGPWMSCRCAHQWIDVKQARRPKHDAQRDAVLGEMVHWFITSSRRFWTCIPAASKTSVSSGRSVFHHMRRWSMESEDGGFKWLDIDHMVRAEPCQEGLTRHIEQCGFAVKPVASINENHLRDAELGEACDSAYKIFKSMRRYAMKHVLGNRTQLLVWMGTRYWIGALTDKVASDPYALKAWAIFHWMQTSCWRPQSMHLWLLRTLAHPVDAPRAHDPTVHWPRTIAHPVVVGAQDPAQDWIANWVNAATILSLWPTEEEYELRVSTETRLGPPSFLSPRGMLRWWAWQTEGKHLKFGSYRHSPLWLWTPAKRGPAKDDKRARWAKRNEDLRTLMGSSMLRRYERGDWRLWRCEPLPLGLVIRTGRLLRGKPTRHRFAVAQIIDPELPDQRVWLLRNTELPVCVLSVTIRAGLKELKLATAEYQATI